MLSARHPQQLVCDIICNLMTGNTLLHHDIELVVSQQVVSSLSTRLMGSYDMRHSQTQFFTKPSEADSNTEVTQQLSEMKVFKPR